MKKIFISAIVLLTIAINPLYASEKVEALPETAFRVLKSGDIKLLETILPKETDVYEYLKRNKAMIEEIMSKPLTEEQMRMMSQREEDKTRRKVKKQLVKISKSLKEKGIDLSKAELIGIKDKAGKKYTENPKVSKVDIYLHIKVGEKTVIIKLDDCIFGVSSRKLGDGYRLQ